MNLTPQQVVDKLGGDIVGGNVVGLNNKDRQCYLATWAEGVFSLTPDGQERWQAANETAETAKVAAATEPAASTSGRGRGRRVTNSNAASSAAPAGETTTITDNVILDLD